MAKSTKRINKGLVIALVIIGVGLITVAAIGIAQYYLITKTGDPYPSNVPVVSDGRVSEKPVTVNGDYVVPEGEPRTISIPSINVTAYVQKVGIARDGAMATPNNIYFTGWYVNSAIPGDIGVSIINGHVGGKYNPGIFKDIKNLKKDDEIKIEMGDLSVRTFSVVSVQSYAEADTSIPLYDDDASIERELHLITCDGVYDDTAKTYNNRLIVVAKYQGEME